MSAHLLKRGDYPYILVRGKSGRRKTVSLGKVFDAIFYLPICEGHLSRVECAFIKRLNPKLNRLRPFVEPKVAELVCMLFEGKR